MAGSLEPAHPSRLPLRASCSSPPWLPLFLKAFPFSPTLSSLALPSPAATTGRAAAPFVLSSPCPLPAMSASRYACAPLLFPSAVRDGAPQTLTKLFAFGSESSYNILPTNFDFVRKNNLVYMCTPMFYAGSAPAAIGLGFLR